LKASRRTRKEGVGEELPLGRAVPVMGGARVMVRLVMGNGAEEEDVELVSVGLAVVELMTVGLRVVELARVDWGLVELRYHVIVVGKVDAGGRVFGGGVLLPSAAGPVFVDMEVGRGSQSSHGGRAGSSAIVVGDLEEGFDAGGLLKPGKGRGPLGKGYAVVTAACLTLSGDVYVNDLVIVVLMLKVCGAEAHERVTETEYG
jgi:hypothetical protein